MATKAAQAESANDGSHIYGRTALLKRFNMTTLGAAKETEFQRDMLRSHGASRMCRCYVQNQ